MHDTFSIWSGINARRMKTPRKIKSIIFFKDYNPAPHFQFDGKNSHDNFNIL